MTYHIGDDVKTIARNQHGNVVIVRGVVVQINHTEIPQYGIKPYGAASVRDCVWATEKTIMPVGAMKEIL